MIFFNIFLIFCCYWNSWLHPSQNYMNESEFLTNSGFVELVENFKKEEIEVPHILRLDNSTLRELGVSSIDTGFRILQGTGFRLKIHLKSKQMSIQIHLKINIKIKCKSRCKIKYKIKHWIKIMQYF